ncbi:hypothetical protein H2198_004521 [Neophaeococcomyces mojaviensis]|uniref:Uncharacterized protein n=1 Tax=Neophaeococcomyces mojaviensis TaxID=3383035 RepID=A0ACC3A8F2_9EURO|nr:hypothetical protein H2198_004521 [Knufia sp. JES_112]
MSNRVEGERVFCYQCENEWDRAHGGLQCPRCESEFVEILEPGSRPPIDPPEVAPESPTDIEDSRHPLHGLHDHNPWAPDPDEGDIRTIHFNTGGGGHGTLRFTGSYTTSFGGGRSGRANMPNDPAADEVMRNFHQMFSSILGPGPIDPSRTRGGFGVTTNFPGRSTTFATGSHEDQLPRPVAVPEYGPSRDGNADALTDETNSLLSLMFPGAGQNRGPGGMGGFLEMLMNPANARSGDTVFSQEAFDRVMSQLMEQNQQNGAPPAAEDLINQLPKRRIDESMMGTDGHAECSICMDTVEMGSEVTVLPCNHWFHFECIQSWLKEHDTCPHCRKSITPEDQRNQQQPRNQRRSSRRSSSVASPLVEAGGQNPFTLPDSPSGLRNARERFYGRRADSEVERPSNERRSSRRSTGSRDDSGGGESGGGGGGITGWVRSHNPFS